MSGRHEGDQEHREGDVYDMYPRAWAEDRDDSVGFEAEVGERSAPQPRRRPRRAHPVAPRVRLTHV